MIRYQFSALSLPLTAHQKHRSIGLAGIWLTKLIRKQNRVQLYLLSGHNCSALLCSSLLCSTLLYFAWEIDSTDNARRLIFYHKFMTVIVIMIVSDNGFLNRQL